MLNDPRNSNDVDLKKELKATYDENNRESNGRVLEAIENISNHPFIYEQFIIRDETIKSLETKYIESFERWLNESDLEQKELYFNESRISIAMMNNILSEYIDYASEESRAMISSVNNGLAMIIIVVILFFAVITIVTVRYLQKNLKKTQEYMARLAGKDLTLKIDPNSLNQKDEFGDLNRSVDEVVKAFNNILTEINEGVGTLSTTSKELRQSTTSVNNSIGEISSTVSEMADGATQQAVDTETVSHDVSNLGEIIGENTESARCLSIASDEITSASQEGMSVVDSLSTITEDNSKAFESIFSIIEETSHSASKIGEASQLITAIAEQTNLLALNAAIEAARAGEAGRGFAVVADEIRKPAEQSTQSTNVIDSMLMELTNNVTEASDQSEYVKKAVQTQVDSVRLTKDKYKLITEIVEVINMEIETLQRSSLDMDKKRNNVFEVVEALSSIAEENAASTEETAAITESVNDTMTTLDGTSNEVDGLVSKLASVISGFQLD